MDVSSDLVQLVMRQAPLSGTRYYALLYLALSADDRDVAVASSAEIARSMRLGKRRCDAALKELERDGYITRPRWGDTRNRYVVLFRIHREGIIANAADFGAAPKSSPRKISRLVPRSHINQQLSNVQSLLE